MKNQYEVNPNAEVVGNTVAKAVLTICIICAIICLIVGIVICVDADEGIGIAVIIFSLVFVIAGIINWAMLKMFVNISRSLYNINDALRSGKEEVQIEEIVAENEREGDVPNAPFKKGQLVIIKDIEEQFRIDDVIEKDGKYSFFSKKFDKFYMAEEIEDFDKYWKENGRK